MYLNCINNVYDTITIKKKKNRLKKCDNHLKLRSKTKNKLYQFLENLF